MAKKCIANKTGTYLIHLDYITLNLLLQIFSLLTDMVTASYCTPAMQDLHKDALEAGITIVNEVSIYCCVHVNFRKSLTSEATPSATQFFKRAYKISHFPGL